MRVTLTVLLAALLMQVLQPASAEQVVRVGAYHFPPYVTKPESDEPGGLLPELLGLLNRSQGEYRFVLLPTSTARRYRDFRHARFDMMIFESSAWGWQGVDLTSLDLGIEDAEVYVARAEPGRGQDYFAELKGKRLALYSGYHYGFAGFNADQAFLTENYRAMLTYSHDSNLLMVLRGRADVAVVTRSYLQAYLAEHPRQGNGLLVSERVDQEYHHQALVRPGAPLSASALAVLLDDLRRSGELDLLLRRYYLSMPEGALTTP